MNLRPPGYEPDELPDCSTPRYKIKKWVAVDSNHRRRCQQIYSLSPLATREATHMLFYNKADDRTRTDNLLITNQLLCQLSHIGEFLFSVLLQTTQIGLEPTASAVTGRRSNQLSHWAMYPENRIRKTYILFEDFCSLNLFRGQACDRLVTVSSIHYCTSTSALSTSSSSRGLTSL